MMRRDNLWAILAAVFLLPWALCGGWFWWATRPRMWPAQATAAAPQIVVHGPLDAARTSTWLVGLLLERHPRARRLELSVGAGAAQPLMAWPEPVVVLGSATVEAPWGATTYLWLEIPAQDDALARVQQHLARQGWREPRWARLEAQPGDATEDSAAEPLRPARRVLCGPDGQWANLRWWRGGAGPAAYLLLQMEIEAPQAGFAPPCDTRSLRRSLAEMPRLVRNLIADLQIRQPLAWPTPPGVEVQTTLVQPWEQSRFIAYAWLRGPEAALDPQTLLETYARGWREQGWRLTTHTVGTDAARGHWVRTPWLGPQQHLEGILIHDLPDQALVWTIRYAGDTALPPQAASTPTAAPWVAASVGPAAEAVRLEHLWQVVAADDAGPDARLEVYAAAAMPDPEVPWPAGVSPLGMLVRAQPWQPVPERTWWAHMAADAAEALQRWDRTWRGAGWLPEVAAWEPPRPAEGLLEPNLNLPPWFEPEATYCHPATRRRMHLSLRPTQNQGTWLTLSELPGPDLPCETPPSRAPARPQVPALRLPAAWPRIPVGARYGPRGLRLEALWVRAADPLALRRDLDAQIEAQGWRPLRRGAELDLAWSVWQPADLGEKRLLRLYLARMEGPWTWIVLSVEAEP